MITFYKNPSQNQEYFNNDIYFDLMSFYCYQEGNLWKMPYSIALEKINDGYITNIASGLAASSKQELITRFNALFISRFYDVVDDSPTTVFFELKNNLPNSFDVDLENDFLLVSDCCLKSSSFDTELYSELLDNSNFVGWYNDWASGAGAPTPPTDNDFKTFKLIEDYNKNVLSLRATKKVDANVNGSISQSGQSDTDLSPVVQQLSNLNNKLQRVDENQETKNITQTINDLSLSNQTVITTVEKAPYNPLLDDGSDIDF